MDGAERAIFYLIPGGIAAFLFWQIAAGILFGRVWVGPLGLFDSRSSSWADRDAQPWSFWWAVIFNLCAGTFLFAEAAHLAGLIKIDPTFWSAHMYHKLLNLLKARQP